MDFYRNRFIINGELGNNKFSFNDRSLKFISVADLIYSDNLEDLFEGEVAFCEFVDGNEFICNGLKNFLVYKFNDIPVYIFDNHNHTFFFTVYESVFKSYKNLKMIHIDQHKDMRKPDISFEEYKNMSYDIRKNIIKNNTLKFESSYGEHDSLIDRAYEYTNIILNVGNYIVPLIEAKFVDKVIIVDSTSSLREVDNEAFGEYFINLDLDFFSEDMDYISFEEKLTKIRKIMVGAKFITISTSPYFVDLNRCLVTLSKLFP
ncbi:MAG: UPF0489 family protein [Filifactoraceae bacterium]